eukprot:jgi/Chlat1/4554/Chrsp29S04458
MAAAVGVGVGVCPVLAARRRRSRRLAVGVRADAAAGQVEPVQQQGEGLQVAVERGCRVTIQGSFYRKESSVGRDLAVLAAALHKEQHGSLRVLDVMSGSGVRPVRYLSQAGADFVWANDASPSTHAALLRNMESTGSAVGKDMLASQDVGSNLEAGSSAGRWGRGRTAESTDGRWRITHQDAVKLLYSRFLENDFYDVVDVDSFGSNAIFIGAAMAAVKYNGLLYITSTDGFSAGGHHPERALAMYGCYARATPAANEQGLRMLLGAAVREAALRGLAVTPVFSIFAPHGPVFRCMLRVFPSNSWPHQNYGFVAHCFLCGESTALSWRHLGNALCKCRPAKPQAMIVTGPLWTGPLHDSTAIDEMSALACRLGWASQDNGSGERVSGMKDDLRPLLQILRDEAQPQLPPYYYPTSEIARYGKLAGVPRRDNLLKELAKAGYAVSRSHVDSGAVKTNASHAECIQLASMSVPPRGG